MANDGALQKLYSKRARFYDLTSNLYYLIGARVNAYRKAAIGMLRLQPGDRVMEIGCGSGLNLGLLQRAVGPKGRILGVDATPAMLAKARRTIRRRGWSNVTLIDGDAADTVVDPKVDAILCSFVLSVADNRDRVIAQAAANLRNGGRCVVLDVCFSQGRLGACNPLAQLLTKAFGTSRDKLDWNSAQALGTHFGNISSVDRYFGFIRISCGEGPLEA